MSDNGETPVVDIEDLIDDINLDTVHELTMTGNQWKNVKSIFHAI